MKQEEKIKEFKKLYAGKVMELNDDLMPIMRKTISPEARTPDLCEKRILKFPECRTALAIMLQEFHGLYFPKDPSVKD